MVRASSPSIANWQAYGYRLWRVPELARYNLRVTATPVRLEGVAGALGLELRTHSLALEWVRARYEELARLGYVASAEMTPSSC